MHDNRCMIFWWYCRIDLLQKMPSISRVSMSFLVNVTSLVVRKIQITIKLKCPTFSLLNQRRTNVTGLGQWPYSVLRNHRQYFFCTLFLQKFCQNAPTTRISRDIGISVISDLLFSQWNFRIEKTFSERIFLIQVLVANIYDSMTRNNLSLVIVK